jgi:hypothetical protein
MASAPIQFNTIDEAVEDFRSGKILIVVDDEDRENEGDFILAAEKVTPEAINFFISEGRGVVCAPITAGRSIELNLDLMVDKNTSIHETPFTPSIICTGQRREFPLSIVLQRYGRWPIRTLKRKISEGRGIFFLCALWMEEFFGVPVTRKQLLISADLPAYNRPLSCARFSMPTAAWRASLNFFLLQKNSV